MIDALRRAGLYDEVAGDLDRSALRLSGGQQQRLCIARALAAQPEVLLLDEPCSALDPISTATIEELIVGLRDSVAIVIVTHNLQQAFRVADHVAFMHLGELVEYGPPSRCSTARPSSARASTSAERSGEPWRTGLPARGARAGRACRSFAGRAQAAGVALVLVALTLALSGCRRPRNRARASKRPPSTSRWRPGMTITHVSTEVQVLSATVVHSTEGAAAAVTVRNSSSHTLSAVPIAITVKSTGGQTLYQNNAPGLEAGSRRSPRSRPTVR